MPTLFPYPRKKSLACRECGSLQTHYSFWFTGWPLTPLPPLSRRHPLSATRDALGRSDLCALWPNENTEMLNKGEEHEIMILIAWQYPLYTCRTSLSTIHLLRLYLFTVTFNNIFDIFVMLGGRFFSTVGIPVGTTCPPLLTDLFLYSYEADLIQGLQDKRNQASPIL